MKGTILATIFIIFSLPVFSQKGYELGVLAGASFYVGDINPNYGLKSPEPTLQFLGRYNFNSRTSLRMDVAAGRLTGRDSISENPFQQARNLSFRSDYLDASIDLEFNFFNYVHGSRNQYFTPYVYGGLGFTYFNPRAKLDDEWHGLRDLGTEGQRPGDEYARISPALSYGIGFKMDFNYEWSLNVEVAARQMFTDYIDDVSTVYPNQAELLLNRGALAVALSDRSAERGIEPIGEQGRQRGVSGDKDAYYSIRIGVVYYIGMLLCPQINRHQ
ncbi:MAG: porin family protein [Bacteroidota bacterium]|nr:porin family protein [Bacteroidota bacterium]